MKSFKHRAIFILVVAVVILPGAVWLGLRRDPHSNRNEALVTAVRNRNASLVHELLAKGANPNTRLKPLCWWEVPKNDEESADEPSREPTLLMLAAMRGDVAVTKTLLDGGADSNAKDNMGSTASDWATEHPEVLRMLKNYQK